MCHFLSTSVLAHSGQPIAPHDVWQQWNLAVPLLPLMLAAVWLYTLGTQRLRQRANTLLPRWRTYAFYSGMVLLFLTLLSPIDALSEVLFSVHMVQHMLLVNAVAPLLILASIPLVYLRAMPPSLARRLVKIGISLSHLWHPLRHRVTVWVLFVGIFGMWHIPLLYELALANPLVHDLEHVTLLMVGLLFWWVLLKPNEHPRVHHAQNVLYLFMTMLQGTGLGVLIVFSRQPWYTSYNTTAALWGIDPLIDQQLAGLVMWLPGGALYTILAVYAMAMWLRAVEETAPYPKTAQASEHISKGKA